MAEDGTAAPPEISAGYTLVDAQPDASVLVAGMDETATFPAVRHLRAWERARLALVPGDRLLDVGCGPGDVAIELSGEVAPNGWVLGLDASQAMIEVARTRAAQAGSTADFRVADARSLTVGDAEVDACRSERMLQWVPDIDRAASELVRVVRPGGRLVVTDTDWRSLQLDRVDPGVVEAVKDAMRALRGPGFGVGARLPNIFRDLGLIDVNVVAATHVWTEWDPDGAPGPSGFFPFRAAMRQLSDLGLLAPEIAEHFVRQTEDAGRRGRMCMSLTMYGVFGRTPG